MTGTTTTPDDVEQRWIRRSMRSYRLMRWWIGAIAFLLPVVLLVWGLALDDVEWFTDGIPTATSLSAYYYTSARNVFIGSLWAVGVFLVFYRGRTSSRSFWAGVAGVAAILVASIPTGAPSLLKHIEGTGETSGVGPAIHGISAIVFFVVMAWWIWWVFPRSGRDGRYPYPAMSLTERINRFFNPPNSWRNRFHQLLAGVIVIQMVVLVGQAVNLYDLWHGALFWFESGMLLCVGLSWQLEFTELYGIRSITNAMTRAVSFITGVSRTASGRSEMNAEAENEMWP